MTVSGHNRLTIVLGLGCIALLVMYACVFWSYGWLKIVVSFASEETQLFEEMRNRALQSDTTGAVECLEYVVNYYPSGSKQVEGSKLDRIVERARTSSERDIIIYLRTKTGSDLGDKPEPWIQEYGKK